ncbi:MAG: dUTP diphosphatase [Chitinivibrionales bacterium]|nr:dUTP diphosphatase [Chitinivibrionales bacterium]
MKPSQQISVKRLPHGKGLPVPRRMTEGSSGFDLTAAVQNELVLGPGERALVPTGFCCEIPRGYEIQVRPRSGLAVKYGVTVLNAPGTIDADYRGEVKVILVNLGNEPHTIKRGDRIAQAVPSRVAADIEFTETRELGSTVRGDGGFGSSGR